MLNREELLTALRTVNDLPTVRRKDGRRNHRTIYEWGDSKGRGMGRFGVDYATFSGGTADEVPLSLIQELEREGVIVRAFPDIPDANGWVLKDDSDAGVRP